MSITHRFYMLSLIFFFLVVVPVQVIADDSLIVTDNGYVGIGTTTPVKMLTVNGSFLANTNTGTTPFYVSRATVLDQALRIEVDDSNVYFYSEQDEDDTQQRGGFTFVMDDDGSMIPEYQINLKSGTRLMTIEKSGYVGIGTSDPSYALDVNGVIRAGSWTSDSDILWKENIETIGDALEKITQLRGVTYNWIDESRGDGPQIGVIAQEVEEIFPEVVHTDSQGYKSVEYSKLIAPLIEAIKTLQAENNDLKRRLSAIETKLADE